MKLDDVIKPEWVSVLPVWSWDGFRVLIILQKDKYPQGYKSLSLLGQPDGYQRSGTPNPKPENGSTPNGKAASVKSDGDAEKA